MRLFKDQAVVVAVVPAGEETELLVGLHNEGKVRVAFLVCYSMILLVLCSNHMELSRWLPVTFYGLNHS